MTSAAASVRAVTLRVFLESALIKRFLLWVFGKTISVLDQQRLSQYQTQLEQQLEGLISQLQGAGRTTVMVTLTTGEETVYAVDTQTGELQQQETHVLLQDGSALAETTYLPQVCGVAVLCEGGVMSARAYCQFK